MIGSAHIKVVVGVVAAAAALEQRQRQAVERMWVVERLYLGGHILVGSHLTDTKTTKKRLKEASLDDWGRAPRVGGPDAEGTAWPSCANGRRGRWWVGGGSVGQ